MEVETKDLRDYIEAFSRRRNSILLVAAVLFAIAIMLAILWPPTYRSTATILIEEQEIPPELIRSTITSYATQRIQTISQTVMTRANLTQVIDKYNLYADKRRSSTTEELMQRIRQDIKLDMINSEVIDPRSGRPTTATIAFTLSYESNNPEIAQKVANELTTLYLNENLKTRTEKAAETTGFLTDEAEKLNQYITELESKLASFKQKHADRLPELQGFNLQLAERIEKEISDIESQLRVLDERKFYLEGQLAQTSPIGPMTNASGERVLDPESRLKMLRSEHIAASSKYSPDHPDVVRLRREIDELEKKVGAVDASPEQARELANLRGELAAARQKYSDDHPDVIRLSRAVTAMESALKQRPVSPEMEIAREKPENPAYIMLKSQLDGINSEKMSLAKQREELKSKKAFYEKNLAMTPEVEREYRLLLRDHENSVRRYQEIKAKQMQAEIGQQLEQERKGEKFSLIDPPHMPEEPVSPNRPAIIIVGFLLSIAGGVGFGAVAERLDGSVRSVRGVTELVSVPPLSVIPYMKNGDDVARTARMRKIGITAAVACIILAVILVHLLWTPLDVLWFRGLRKVDSVMGS